MKINIGTEINLADLLQSRLLIQANSSWTSSNKCYAQLYVDDAALGCPLIHGETARPYVDWNAVQNYLIHKKIL